MCTLLGCGNVDFAGFWMLNVGYTVRLLDCWSCGSYCVVGAWAERFLVARFGF